MVLDSVSRFFRFFSRNASVDGGVRATQGDSANMQVGVNVRSGDCMFDIDGDASLLANRVEAAGSLSATVNRALPLEVFGQKRLEHVSANGGKALKQAGRLMASTRFGVAHRHQRTDREWRMMLGVLRPGCRAGLTKEVVVNESGVMESTGCELSGLINPRLKMEVRGKWLRKLQGDARQHRQAKVKLEDRSGLSCRYERREEVSSSLSQVKNDATIEFVRPSIDAKVTYNFEASSLDGECNFRFGADRR